MPRTVALVLAALCVATLAVGCCNSGGNGLSADAELDGLGEDAGPDGADEDAGDDADAADSDVADDDVTTDVTTDVAEGDTVLQITSPEDRATLASGQAEVVVAYEVPGRESTGLVLAIWANGSLVGEAVLGAEAMGSVAVTVDLLTWAGTEDPVLLRATLADGVVIAESDPVTVVVGGASAALDLLDGRAQGAVRITMEQGIPTLVSADVPVTGADPVERALDYLREFGDLYGFDDPDNQLFVGDVVGSALPDSSEETVVFSQRHLGVPVYGADLRVHLQGDMVTSTLGRWIRPEVLENNPRLQRAMGRHVGFREAQANAVAFIGLDLTDPVGMPRLVWFEEEELVDPLDAVESPRPFQLAWQLTFVSALHPEATTWEIFVSAESGAVLEMVPLEYDATLAERVEIWDANGHQIGGTCGTVFDPDYSSYQSVCDGESCFADPIHAEAEAARVFSNVVYDYYRTHLGRRSWDNDDEQIEAYLDSTVANAQYSPHCDVMQFRNGWVQRDVLAHEFTHGVVAHEANLRYKNASGALNESYADVFGELVDGEAQGIGFDCAHFTTRDMCNPAAYGDPDHVSEYCTRPECGVGRWEIINVFGTDIPIIVGGDHGGVHQNSGIMNVVAALLARGGTHPHSGIFVAPIGPDKVSRLWYDVLRHDISKSSGLTRMCQALRARSTRYGEDGTYGFTSADACQVAMACAGSGFNDVDSDCDGTLDSLDEDRDGDGRANEVDNCPDLRNPAQRDRDDDGVGDVCDNDLDGDGRVNAADNCIGTPNPDQTDNDGNGLGDICDDEDRDYVYADTDNCPDDYNYDQADYDGDGIGDLCDDDQDGDGFDNAVDNCRWFENTTVDDDDFDGHGDECDNCLGAGNVDQADVDQDGQGDVCDDDADDDGLLNADDNCPLHHNVDQFDGDGDGDGFACDVEEQRVAFEGRTERIVRVAELLEANRALLFPIPVCGADCDSHFAPGTVFEILLETNAYVDVAIVDQSGRRLADGDLVSGSGFEMQAAVRFAPRSEALAFGPFNQAMVGTQYFVRVGFQVGASGQYDHAMTMTVVP